MCHAWERRENYKRFWWENQTERDHSEDHGLDGSMGSVWIIGRLAKECKLESTGSGLGLVQSCCKRGDKPSGSCPTELLS
jgi:hypothetical protein